MSSKNNVLVTVSTVLLASVCLPIIANAQFHANGTDATVFSGGSSSTNNAALSAAGASNGAKLTGGNVTLNSSNSASAIKAYTGGQVILNKVTAQTVGNTSIGLVVDGPGIIDLTESTVTTTGTAAYGAKLHGEGSVLKLTNTALRAEKAGAIYARNGAEVTVIGGVLQAGGISANGAALELINSNGSLTDVEIETKSGGVKAESTDNSDLGTHAVLNNVNIVSTDLLSRGVYATGAKTAVEVNKLTFTSDGQGSDGIYATENSSVTISSSEITTTGVAAHGVFAQKGAKVTISDETEIKVSNDNSTGVTAATGAEVIIDNSSIYVSGSRQSQGVYATDDGTRVTIKNDTTIDTTEGSRAHGIRADGGAVVDVSDTKILSSGNGLNVGTGGTLIADDISVTSERSGVVAASGTYGPAEVTISNSRVESSGTGGSEVYGMHVTGTTSKIISDSVELVTDSHGRNGFVAQDGGTMIMTDGSITTEKSRSTGGYVNSGTAIISGTEITTSGLESHGLSAHVDGDIDLTGIKIKTSGEDAKGLLVFERGFIHGDAEVVTTGMGAHGIAAASEGKISLENSNISTTGEFAAGIAAAPRDFGIPFVGKATIEIADSTVTSQNGASVFVSQGSDLDLKLLNTDLLVNNGDLSPANSSRFW